MEQKIIIRRGNYFQEREEENINELFLSYSPKHFHEYEKFSNYLNIQIGGHNGLDINIEIPPREAERLFSKLANQASARNNF